MKIGGRWTGASSMQSHLGAPINEPTIILMDVQLLWRADPNEKGPDLLTSLAWLSRQL